MGSRNRSHRAFLMWLVVLTIMIATFGEVRYEKDDAAIILGAGVDTNKPSPVFEARIRHALDLFDQVSWGAGANSPGNQGATGQAN